MLTGKAKEAFISWMHTKPNYPYSTIFNLPIVIQTAFIIEWLDTVGYLIQITLDYDKMFEYNRGFDWELRIDKGGKYNNNRDCFEDREEGLINAINKSNEIYNLNHEPI